MNTTSTQQLGFTLVEMMIAVAILEYSAEMIDASTSRAYRLKAIPTKTGYTLSVWMDSLGNAYKCTDIDSADKFKTTMTNGKGCESVSKKKSS